MEGFQTKRPTRCTTSRTPTFYAGIAPSILARCRAESDHPSLAMRKTAINMECNIRRNERFSRRGFKLSKRSTLGGDVREVGSSTIPCVGCHCWHGAYRVVLALQGSLSRMQACHFVLQRVHVDVAPANSTRVFISGAPWFLLRARQQEPRAIHGFA